MVISTVGLAVSTALLTKAAQETAVERDESHIQRRRAESNFHLALQALDEIYLEVAESRLPNKSQLTAADSALLKKALKFWRRAKDKDHRNDKAVNGRRFQQTSSAINRPGCLETGRPRIASAE